MVIAANVVGMARGRQPGQEGDLKSEGRFEMRLQPQGMESCSPVVNQGEGYDYSVKLRGTRSECEIGVTRPIGADGCPSKHPLYVR